MVYAGYCLKEKKTCVRWVERYFDDCLCNLNDEVSFALGIVSLICWGVAEIPQIITNFRTKSSHGVSLSFLLAWVAGDIFNLIGCLLEPATLPTQFYTALLYTVSTVVLVIQTIYYDYIYRLCTHGRTKICQKDEEDEEKKPLNPPKTMGSAISIPGESYKASPRKEFYYTTVLSFQLLLAMKVSGVSDSEKMTGETAIPSDSVNPISQSGVSSGDNGPTKSRCGMADSKGTSKSGPQSGITSGVDKPVKSRGTTAETQRPIRTHGRTGGSSGPVIGVRGRPSVSAIDKGKSIVSDDVGKVITFKDVKFGPHEDEIRFRLIHFWEAWNVQTKVLIGIEMLLIDEEASVIQGFISYGRIETYLPHMKAGCTYRLNKFYGSKSKTVYRIADSDVTISFSWNSALTALEDSSICFPEDRIRIHGFREFDGASDLKGDLYDYIGHIKLVNGKVPTDSILLDEGEIAVSRRVELHVQTHDDPVMKLYLWDKAAFEFIDKFKASRGTARVILVTTLNPKRFGGVLSLSAMASSRVFMDSDIQETLSYLSWLNSNLDVASRVNAEVITKPEPATLGELFAYMNQASSKVAWFECTATIDDVVHGSGWYYIGCGVCHTKATKGPTTLMCKKCGKSEIVGVAQYLTRLSVYDNNDQAVFVVLGDAGEELTGKKASELVEKYYQVNDNIEGDHKVPVPQAMIDTIGQTRKFIVKVSKHNLDAKTQTLTVTKVLPPDAAGPEDNLEGDVDVIGDAEGVGNAAEFGKRGADEIESEGVKRAKCG